MTVQKMKTTKTQTNRFLDGFQNIQNTVMGTTCKENIPHYKCQLMMKSILHKLPTISLNQQRSIPPKAVHDDETDEHRYEYHPHKYPL